MSGDTVAQNPWLSAAEAAAYLRLGKHGFYDRVVHDPSVPRSRVGVRKGLLWRHIGDGF